MKNFTPFALFLMLSVFALGFHLSPSVANAEYTEIISNETNNPDEIVNKINKRLRDNHQRHLNCVFKNGDFLIENKTEVLYTVTYNKDYSYSTGFDRHHKLKYLYITQGSKIIEYHEFKNQ